MSRFLKHQTGVIAVDEIAEIKSNLSALNTALCRFYSLPVTERKPQELATLLGKLFVFWEQLIDAPKQYVKRFKPITMTLRILFDTHCHLLNNFEDLHSLNPYLAAMLKVFFDNIGAVIRGDYQYSDNLFDHFSFLVATDVAAILATQSQQLSSIVDTFLYLPSLSLSKIKSGLNDLLMDSDTSTDAVSMLVLLDNFLRHINTMAVEKQRYNIEAIKAISQLISDNLSRIINSLKEKFDSTHYQQIETLLVTIQGVVSSLEAAPDTTEMIFEDHETLIAVIDANTNAMNLPPASGELIEACDAADFPVSTSIHPEENTHLFQLFMKIVLQCHTVIMYSDSSKEEPAQVSPENYNLLKELLYFLQTHIHYYRQYIQQCSRVYDNRLTPSLYRNLEKVLSFLEQASLDEMFTCRYSEGQVSVINVYLQLAKIIHSAATAIQRQIKYKQQVVGDTAPLLGENSTLLEQVRLLEGDIYRDFSGTKAYAQNAAIAFHRDPGVATHLKVMRKASELNSLFFNSVYPYVNGLMPLVYQRISTNAVRVAYQTTTPPTQALRAIIDSAGGVFFLSTFLATYAQNNKALLDELRRLIEASIDDKYTKKTLVDLISTLDMLLVALHKGINTTVVVAVLYTALMDNISAIYELINKATGATLNDSETISVLIGVVPIAFLAFAFLKINFIDIPKSAERAQTWQTEHFSYLPEELQDVWHKFWQMIYNVSTTKKGRMTRPVAALLQDFLRHILYTFLFTFPALAVKDFVNLFVSMSYSTEKLITLAIYAVAFVMPTTPVNVVMATLRSDGIIPRLIDVLQSMMLDKAALQRARHQHDSIDRTLSIYNFTAARISRLRQQFNLPPIDGKAVETAVVDMLGQSLPALLLDTGNLINVVNFMLMLYFKNQLTFEDAYYNLPFLFAAISLPFAARLLLWTLRMTTTCLISRAEQSPALHEGHSSIDNCGSNRLDADTFESNKSYEPGSTELSRVERWQQDQTAGATELVPTLARTNISAARKRAYRKKPHRTSTTPAFRETLRF